MFLVEMKCFGMKDSDREGGGVFLIKHHNCGHIKSFVNYRAGKTQTMYMSVVW